MAAALLGLVVVGQFSLAKLGVMLWLVSKVAAGAWLGYVIDRHAFPYARPHTLTGERSRCAWMRRAIIMAACILGLGLGMP